MITPQRVLDDWSDVRRSGSLVVRGTHDRSNSKTFRSCCDMVFGVHLFTCKFISPIFFCRASKLHPNV